MYLYRLDKSIQDIYSNIRKDHVYSDSLEEFGVIYITQKNLSKNIFIHLRKMFNKIMFKSTIELRNDIPLN